MGRSKTYFNWSTGKDSALALYHLRHGHGYDVQCLLTAVNVRHDRVSMHGLRRELMLKQVHSMGIPGTTMELPEQPSNNAYEKILAHKVAELKSAGFECAAFGDIFLEDLRVYREEQLQALGMRAVFPLWKRDTRDLMNEFIALGFKAIAVCVNGSRLDRSFAGRAVDHNFLNALPEGIDPCGENGEFHTFCYDGPIFKGPVSFRVGATHARTYDHEGRQHKFWFCDLLPD